MSNYIPANLSSTIQSAEANITTNSSNISTLQTDVTNLQNDYETKTYSAVWDGGDTDTASSYTLTSTRNGKNVVISFPPITLTAIVTPAAFFEYKATVLDVAYRPTYSINKLVRVTDNTSVDQVGVLEITSGGVIRVYANINKTTTWTASPGTSGWENGMSISYSLQ